jgi:hypothetical protein
MFGSELLGAGVAEGAGVVSWGLLVSAVGAGVSDDVVVIEVSSLVGGGAAGVVAFTEVDDAASQLLDFLRRDLLK